MSAARSAGPALPDRRGTWISGGAGQQLPGESLTCCVAPTSPKLSPSHRFRRDRPGSPGWTEAKGANAAEPPPAVGLEPLAPPGFSALTLQNR